MAWRGFCRGTEDEYRFPVILCIVNIYFEELYICTLLH